MRVDEARTILEYAADIPAKLRTIAAERAEIEGELSCLHGIEYGGMPTAAAIAIPRRTLLNGRTRWAILTGCECWMYRRPSCAETLPESKSKSGH